MGEIVEGLINGDFDFYTGEYLGRGGGYPRTKKNIKGRKRGARFYRNNFSEKQKSKGVHWFLFDKGIKDTAQQDLIIRQYAFEFDIKVPKKKEITNLCIKIQDKFQAFANWVNKNIKEQ